MVINFHHMLFFDLYVLKLMEKGQEKTGSKELASLDPVS